MSHLSCQKELYSKWVSNYYLPHISKMLFKFFSKVYEPYKLILNLRKISEKRRKIKKNKEKKDNDVLNSI